MESLGRILVILTFGVVMVLGAPRSTLTKDLPSPRLVDLGSVDGKSFYYQLDSGLTWYQARSFCANGGMSLATITSQAQQTFLQSKAALGGFYGDFWTAARDVGTLNQFSWNDSAPLGDFGQKIEFNTWFSCVYYTAAAVGTENNGAWASWHCAVSAVNGVLCEM